MLFAVVFFFNLQISFQGSANLWDISLPTIVMSNVQAQSESGSPNCGPLYGSTRPVNGSYVFCCGNQNNDHCYAVACTR
jgi:hypothetical protein